MYSNVTFIQSTNCTNLNQTVTRICLPPIVSCNVDPSGLLAYCDEVWNCNAACQQESKYYLAYQDGDKIQIQSQFYDTENTISDTSTSYEDFFDEILFCGDVTNTAVLSEFASRHMMAFKDGKSYQIIEIDTSLFPDNYWSISLSKGDRSVCSQQFRRLSSDCFEDSFTVRSGCDNTDCFGYCYGVPDRYVGDIIEYDNTLRFFGDIRETGFGTEIVEFGNNKRGVAVDNYLVNFKGFVPQYAKEIISKQMFNCGTVILNGEECEVQTFSLTPDKRGSMWKIAIPITKECNNNAQGNC